MLKVQSTPRHKAQTLILGVLGLAVFVWGLHYKISLYQSEAVQRSVPAARLFSQKPRPALGTHPEKRFRLGRSVPGWGQHVLTRTVGALMPSVNGTAANGQIDAVAQQPNLGGPHFQHVTLPDLRGPPIAI
jgi:hypothetical protein